jgi:hypothetical protein
MNLIKYLRIWWCNLAKVRRVKANRALGELPRTELIPVIEMMDSNPIRYKEIHDLVAQIVLLGQKRGRPSKQEEEDQNAA